MLSPESIQENRTRNVPSGKMLLERLGLHQCQGECGQPVRSKSRIHLKGAFAKVQPVAKHVESNPNQGPLVKRMVMHVG